MEENRLLTRHQYGFRKNHSTTYLMFDLIDEIYKSKSRSYKPGIIFLDIKKAFDTVNHDILLKKLAYYGIHGTVLEWSRNFLLDRFQCTKINGKISSFLQILSGVPQGSILGPLLFSIYINDMIYACNLSKPYLFADDGALFFDQTCRNSFVNMKIELLTIFKWLSVNKLSLNSQKSSFILLPIKYRKMFANALMLPQFDYLDTIYSRASRTKLAELDIIYKKVAKIALDVPRTESSLNVYKDMKWLPLHLRRQLHLANYMSRIIHDNCPTNFSNKFSYISGGSRSSEMCNLYVNRSASHKNFQYLGSKCWNNVPVDLRNLSDVTCFNNSYKKQLLASILTDESYVTDNSIEKFYAITIIPSN